MKMIPREKLVPAISLSNVFNVHIPLAKSRLTQYHRDYINQNLYKPGPCIANVIKEIKTIYQDLTKDNDFACMALHKTRMKV